MKTPLAGRGRTRTTVYGDEYAVVRFVPSWGLVSVACFVVSIPTRYWIRWLPWEPPHSGFYAWWTLQAMLGLSVVGLLTGALGLWLAERKGLARMGLAANALVLALVLLALLAMRWIFQR